MENNKIIAILILAGLLALLGGGYYLWNRFSKGKEDKLKQAWEVVKRLINEALPFLITAAERKFGGGGTGVVKKALVIAEAIKLIPAEFLGLMDLDALSVWIEETLEKLRPLWKDAPALVETAAGIWITGDVQEFIGRPDGGAVEADGGTDSPEGVAPTIGNQD